MGRLLKVLVLVVVAVYVISPVDAAPGPIDDIIVTLLGIAATKKFSVRNDGDRKI
jgi:uncharacterized membrane protein YkvA (DUF1232 family)